MLEPYDGKLSRTVLRREGGGNTADPADYAPLVERLHGQVIHISPASTQYINPMDINSNYSEEDNPLALKADFVLSLCELVVGGKEGLQPVEKTVIDRCVHVIYRKYFENPTPENMPLLEDLYNALLTQDEPEARHVAAALEIYVKGSLNIFNHHTNVDINNRIVCFDIKQLGKQLKKLGMLIVQDAVWGRVTANRSRGFIPASQLALSYVEATEEWLGKTVEVRVIDSDESKKKLVLSAKAILKEQEQKEHDQKVSEMIPGSILEGTVESLMPYGAFVDLGEGVSGLVHISQISQKRIGKPSEVLKEGQKVKVKVLNTNDNKVSLSMKALEEELADTQQNEKAEEYVSNENASTNLGDLLSKLKL